MIIGHQPLEEFLASEERVFCLAKRGPLERWSTPKCHPVVLARARKRLVFSNREGALPGF